MKTFILKIIIAVTVSSFFSSPCFGYEITSRYATLIYADEKQLSEFNRKALKNVFCHGSSVSLSDEVRSKLDVLIGRVAAILLKSQPPEQLKFRILLVNSDADIQTLYTFKHGKGDDYIAFYSPKDNTIFLSVGELRRGILAHELAHVIIHRYYHNAVSGTIHELLAQYVESHIDD